MDQALAEADAVQRDFRRGLLTEQEQNEAGYFHLAAHHQPGCRRRQETSRSAR